ncbi:reverse transcriptase family protein [Alteromonas lipotrueae]|uniref:reverse transcriptase family protein n=1 Tax=Alteromonas lipotrueae TaxID=2803814 RepID=UPI001C48A721
MSEANTVENFQCRQSQIGSIKALAKTLSLIESELIDLAECSDQYYKVSKEIPKSDGSVRRTYSVSYPLKKVLIRIRSRIISNVDYPDYILAGRLGRSYLDNANKHKSSAMILSEDITRFFDSIKQEYVEQIFKYFFHFPPDVAKTLSQLCTLDGYLVQGSPLSGDIANLIFNEKEPNVVKLAAELGLKYSRYYDDIYVSSLTNNFDAHIGTLRTAIYGMFASVEVKPNKSPQKSRVMRSSHRMDVHDVTVNSHKLSPSKKRTSKVRLSVDRLRKMVAEDAAISDILKVYRSTFGQLITLKSQGSPKYVKMRSELDQIMKSIEPAKARKFARKFRNIKTEADFKSFAQKISVLKRISPSVAGVINAESKSAKLKIKFKQATTH